MARPNPELIAAIEKTILKLSKGAPYQWAIWEHVIVETWLKN